MPKSAQSKTINPIHFEDLEPKRFEDLVRQLIYEFKEWQKLEATGRSGSDEGFDARGWESGNPENDHEDESGDNATSEKGNQLWLLQCKREKQIGPKKIEIYADEILKNKDDLYGVIFAAPCDLSLKTRDAFYKKLSKSVHEIHIWGKAELEDMLFHPKNDHLLFAYFGFSIQIRRKSLKSQLRAKLSTKRKAIKALGEVRGKTQQEVLIRDAKDTFYPWKEDVKDYKEKPPWKNYRCIGHYHDGIVILLKRFYAYMDDKQDKWDFYEKENLAKISPYSDFWAEENDHVSDNNAWHFWKDIDENNRYWLEIRRRIPYERILAIDEDGDTYTRHPHIYVDFSEMDGPFEEGYYAVFEPCARYLDNVWNPSEKNRVTFFPKKMPKAKVKRMEEVRKEGNSD